MNTRIAIALTAFAVLGAGQPAFAGADTPDPAQGKRVTSIEEVAGSQRGSYDVYIDAPTGYAFVHTATGWTFVRQVPEVALAADRLAREALAQR